MRQTKVKLWILTVAVAITGGCNGDGTGPTPSGSDPVIMSGVIDLGPQNPAGDRVVYISLAEGAIPHGSSVQAVNLTTFYPISASLKNGGLDPLPVVAEVGDSIRITVRDSSGGSRQFIRQAKKRKPPVVVRADPPDQRTDVVLNRVRIIVVFSEPMDKASFDSGTVRLLRSGQPVPASIVLSADQTYLVISPATPLLPETSYTIIVAAGVRGLDGAALVQPFTSHFTTGAADVVATVTIAAHLDSVEVGVPLALTAEVRDVSGAVLSGISVNWSSSDPSIANIDALGTVRSLMPGEARIVATVEGVSDSTAIVVSPLNFISVTAGGSHSCGVTTSGRAFCWGSNVLSQLGAGPGLPTSSNLPVAVAGSISFGMLSAGDSATCGETADGLAAFCWGGARQWDNHTGYFGNDLPAKVPPSNHPPGSLATVSTGLVHACGLDQSGTAYCWGMYDMKSFKVYGGTWQIPSAGAFTEVAAGGGHSCGVTVSGTLECWGWNDVGQLGDSTLNSTLLLIGGNPTLTTITVQSTSQYTQVSVGRDHSCALTNSGDAHCWGGNSLGQSGGLSVSQCYQAQVLDHPGVYPDMTVPCTLIPAPVSGNLTFTDISAGKGFTCGIASGGTAYCWGRNEANQLGNGNNTESSTPVAVAGGLVFQSISAGGDHACGLTTAGVYCWGSNQLGQLGNGSGVDSGVPVRVSFQP